MKYAVFFLSLFFLFGCKSEPKPADIVEVKEPAEDPERITAKDIEKLRYTDYILSADAKAATATWQKYNDLEAQIELLRKGNLSFFKTEKPLLKTFMEDLKKEQPAAVKSPAIDARILVLETQLLKLQSYSTLSNIKKADILKTIKDFLISFANLNLQINKKLEFESQIIEIPY